MRWAWIWLDHVYCDMVIHLSQAIIVVLFTWIKPLMVIHQMKIVYWISIVVIHIFIILIPKRCKVYNDSATNLWHCCLGHIGVKRMKKLHKDGFLESLGYESFDTYEPCLMVNMTKTLFSGTMAWANDLLEIIHTDVCGPMSIDARGGYHYFQTFTRWFEQIWVYLLNETHVWNIWKVQRISKWSGESS